MKKLTKQLIDYRKGKPLKAKSILVFDDDRDFLESAINFLILDARMPLVTWAIDLREAEDKINKFTPDIVLLDLSMINEDALEVISKIKSTENAPKIIVVSDFDNEDYRDLSRAAGADGFITKNDLEIYLTPMLSMPLTYFDDFVEYFYYSRN